MSVHCSSKQPLRLWKVLWYVCVLTPDIGRQRAARELVIVSVAL